MQANMFLPKLQQLAAHQSPTLLELIQRKIDGGNEEDATDPRYLRGAFAVIAEHYISAIDQGDIKFSTDSEGSQFLWLLQLLIDYATDGKMQELLPSTPKSNKPTKLKIVRNSHMESRVNRGEKVQ
ncbi:MULTISPECIES: hypothetical protein [Methylomonas]|uniref:Uncharacterized protein n=2 Tax=Methylomonas TaxID=416 RepID=A0A140E4Q8_9GAMM|nr:MULTISPECIES: hypothetical protein [Methylomonas]AMK75382.1 hypothetical protein JT25_002575 [Methylomonas denitrificans]OAI08734.1 hypothetical protein A1342_00080 [Methylomonas methanica]TCV72464.1 hypothetical protein EDE11_1513 [Methylomonas methanica]